MHGLLNQVVFTFSIQNDQLGHSSNNFPIHKFSRFDFSIQTESVVFTQNFLNLANQGAFKYLKSVTILIKFKTKFNSYFNNYWLGDILPPVGEALIASQTILPQAQPNFLPLVCA